MYRPGIRAIRELGITSPLALLGITKEEVRKFAGEYGISVSNRPSAPCLATRFPYGTRLNMDKMKQVDQGEAYLRSLGLYNVRIRVHGEVARIEVDEKDMPAVLEMCIRDSYMDGALKAGDLESTYELWQKAQWDGKTGVTQEGDIPWVWLCNVDHLYYVRDLSLIHIWTDV